MNQITLCQILDDPTYYKVAGRGDGEVGNEEE
jgi:hypothetical protein